MTQPVIHRGITIRQFEVPCTPYVWTHDETDGHGTAETLDQARAQIDAHLAKRCDAHG
ncbi:hypothetical protein [Paracoccus marcusii]|uniref:Uncharacterized protein n=1 Tax=Paracoccus marcusii TaxID=59779 RepID=A0ABY7UNB8_9RHOB|nr:hypothetical protein [Paracoccus marcusii]WDA11431.1 hypothetical protein PRL19_08865 [Paracoccus marcusii]